MPVGHKVAGDQITDCHRREEQTQMDTDETIAM